MLFLFLALGASATPIVDNISLEARDATVDSSYFNALVNGLAGGNCPAGVAPGNTDMMPCSRVTTDCAKGFQALNQVLGVSGSVCPDIASSFDQVALQTAFASYASPFCNPTKTLTSTVTATNGPARTFTQTSTVTQTAPAASNTACSPSVNCNGAYKGSQDFNTFAIRSTITDRDMFAGGFRFTTDYQTTSAAYNFVSDGKGGTAPRANGALQIQRIYTSEAFYLKSFDVECATSSCAPKSVSCSPCSGNGVSQLSVTPQGTTANYTTYRLNNYYGPWLWCIINFDASVGRHGWDNFVFNNA